MRKLYQVSFLLASFFLFPRLLRAKEYLWSYEYEIPEEGEFEIEYYWSLYLPQKSLPKDHLWGHLIELEYGISPHISTTILQEFLQKHEGGNSTFSYQRLGFRTRIQLLSKGKFFLDPLFYLEYFQESSLSTPGWIETKLILSKDLGKWNFCYNQIYEKNLQRTLKGEIKYTAGLSYQVGENFRIGIESIGDFIEHGYSLGPTLAYKGKVVGFVLGSVFALNPEAPDIQARMILSIPFEKKEEE